jgi:hypothetical protein
MGVGRNQPAVIRQQMGHTSQRMTALYSGEIPLDQVRAAFSSKTGTKNVVLENKENEYDVVAGGEPASCIESSGGPFFVLTFVRGSAALYGMRS